MATTDNSTEPNIVGFKQDVQNRDDKKAFRTFIRDKLELCSRALARGEPKHYLYVAETICDKLLPALENYTSRSLEEYDRVIDDDEWDWKAFVAYQRRGDEFVETLRRPQRAEESLSWRLEGYVDGVTSARNITERALHSIAAVASYEGVVAGQYKNEADAMGFAIKLGVHKQRPDMNFGDPVGAITRELGSLKHFFTGGTSGGKSSGASRQFEDYYRASVGSGLDYKCLDPIGITTENVNAYDVPQQDSKLRRARGSHGRSPDWSEIEGYEPKAEILVPLTPDLDGYQLPYDTVEQQFLPKRFTIPASDLSEGLLSAAIAARVSSGEQRTIRQAYRDVDRRQSDWSLQDLEQAIKSRQDLSDKDKESAARIISNLASSGFIRTVEDEHALDDAAWHDLFHTTDVITVFNQSPVEDKLARHIIIAYLIDQLWARRRRSHNQPNLVTWLRELHLVVPHREIRRKMDSAVQNVVEYTISVLNNIMRLPRDINTHIIADTQDPTDPEKAIRTRFNRYVVFGGSDDELKKIFSWAGQNKWKSLKNTLNSKPGHAGIIKGCEPAVGDSNRWGISPVHLTPPSWHHHDKDEGPSGWQKRVTISKQVDVMNDEELRDPSEGWDIDYDPGESTYTPTDGVDTDGEKEADDEPSDPMEQLSAKEKAKMEARQLRSHTDLSLAKIAKRIPNNPETGKRFSNPAIMNWVEDINKNSGELVLDMEV